MHYILYVEDIRAVFEVDFSGDRGKLDRIDDCYAELRRRNKILMLISNLLKQDLRPDTVGSLDRFLVANILILQYILTH